MTELLSQNEALPSTYLPELVGDPDLPETVRNTPTSAAFQRIEHFIAFRYTPRSVTWIVKGPGEWLPPLAPVSELSAEVWKDQAWSPIELMPQPNGYWLDDETYRVTATVGADNHIPPAVWEAAWRLSQYLTEAETYGRSGSSVSHETQWSTNELAHLPPDRKTSESRRIDRSQNWMARALQYSGAGDLLRPYRTVR